MNIIYIRVETLLSVFPFAFGFLQVSRRRNKKGKYITLQSFDVLSEVLDSLDNTDSQ